MTKEIWELLHHWSSGPLSSVLTNRFGFQFVVMTGGILISSGTIATSFTCSINQMYITYGLVAGTEIAPWSFVSLLEHRIMLFFEFDFRHMFSWIRVFHNTLSTVQVLATVLPSCLLWPSFPSTSHVDGLWSQLWLPRENPCPCLPWRQVSAGASVSRHLEKTHQLYIN